MVNHGKVFEKKFKEDFLKIEGADLVRLYDPVGGYRGIRNICDYIGYIKPNIFYLECKSIEGNTFPLSNLTQYDKLSSKVGIPGVRAGVIIWFIDHEKVLYIPITTFVKLKESGKKSYNINKMIESEEYKAIEIPSTKRKFYLDSDYSILKNTEDMIKGDKDV